MSKKVPVRNSVLGINRRVVDAYCIMDIQTLIDTPLQPVALVEPVELIQPIEPITSIETNATVKKAKRSRPSKGSKAIKQPKPAKIAKTSEETPIKPKKPQASRARVYPPYTPPVVVAKPPGRRGRRSNAEYLAMQQQQTIKSLVRERVIQVPIDTKYLMYKERPSRVENLCGRFRARVEKAAFKEAIVVNHTCMGWQEDVYNIHGNGSYMNNLSGMLYFKGCKNLNGVYALGNDLGLTKPEVIIHMIVLSACMGEFIDVRPAGLMETILRQIGLDPYRLMDTTNSVRFQVKPCNWMPSSYPRGNDWSITTRGSIIIRMTWKALVWTQEIENDLTEFCDKMMTRLKQALKECKATSVAEPIKQETADT